MSKKAPTTAELLLEAHVAFLLEELTGEGLQAALEQELDHALENATKLTLNDVVTRKMIKDTAHVYAVELELQGGIPELVGDIARNLYSEKVIDASTPHELMSDHQFKEMLNKALEMRELRERLVRDAVSNPLYSALVSDILFHGIKGYLTQNALTKNIPGMSSMMKLGKSVLSAASSLDISIEDNLKKYIQKNTAATLKESEQFLLQKLDDEKLRDIALDIWHDVKKKPLSEYKKLVGSADIEEFFVIGYDYWRELRTTKLYSAVINSGVDSFFDRYGDSTLADLLADIGIERSMMLREAMRFGPHVIKVLKKKKILEPLLRRSLERFYLSDRAAAILAG